MFHPAVRKPEPTAQAVGSSFGRGSLFRGRNPQVPAGIEKRKKTMITNPLRSVHASLRATCVAASLFLLVGGLRAQAPSGPDTSSSTTEDSTGIVTDIAPLRTISVTSRRGPFTYLLGPDLHVVGPDGKAMKVGQIPLGSKVTVYYYLRDGQDTVARVSVLKLKERRDK